MIKELIAAVAACIIIACWFYKVGYDMGYMEGWLEEQMKKPKTSEEVAKEEETLG